jgi:hypothetical protein
MGLKLPGASHAALGAPLPAVEGQTAVPPEPLLLDEELVDEELVDEELVDEELVDEELVVVEEKPLDVAVLDPVAVDGALAPPLPLEVSPWAPPAPLVPVAWPEIAPPSPLDACPEEHATRALVKPTENNRAATEPAR